MSKLGRWLPLAAIFALLAAAMVATIYANPRLERLTDPVPLRAPATGQPEADPTRTTAEPTVAIRPPAAPVAVPLWVTWLVTGLCLAAVVAVVAGLVWLVLRERIDQRRAPARLRAVDPGHAQREARARVRAVLDAGLADLADDDKDPRRAVIGCWVRLERAAALAGTPRRPGDTPTELVLRLLATHAVTGDLLAQFAEVYREARYGQRTVDDTMRDQARAALRQLRDELGAGDVPGAAGDALGAAGGTTAAVAP